MKNIEDYINLAETAMIRQTDYSYYRYSLVVRQRKLTCIASPGMMVDDIFCCGLTRHQLEHGLTNGEWTRMGDKVMKVMKELRL